MAKKEWRQYRYVPLEEQDTIEDILERNLKAIKEGRVARHRPAEKSNRYNKYLEKTGKLRK